MLAATKRWIISLTTLALALYAATASARDYSIGVSFGEGFSFPGRPPRPPMHLMEVAVGRDLMPLMLDPIHIDLAAELTAGAILVAGESHATFSVAVSPILRLGIPGIPLSAIAQLGLGIMPDHTIGRFDVGGPLFFRLGLGIEWRITGRLRLGYRMIHQSNAGLYERNPGANFNLLTMAIAF